MPAGGRSSRLGLAASLLVAAGLIGVAFGAAGGSELSRTTSVEMWMALGGGLLCAGGILLAPRRRPHGAVTTALFVLLAMVTALSIEWSVAAGESWVEANRTLAYLAVFAGAVAVGNLGPGGGEVVVRGVLGAVVAVVAYALASRVWPADLAELDLYARIGQPFGYWNAVGVTAAMGLPLALWLGARRDGRPAVSALAYPAVGLIVVALFLTYSRSALLAATVVLILWIAFVPLRLRSALLVLAAAAAATPVILWATGKAAFTEDAAELSAREDVAPTFGLLLLMLAVVLYGAGLAVARGRERVTLSAGARQRIGRGLAIALAVVAIAGVAGLAAGERGVGGTLSARWDELRDDQAATGGGPDRLGSAASTRGRYWRQARDLFEEDPLAGVGAGAFSVASLRIRDDERVSRHAHGYPAQTLADLGLVGAGVSLALALAWLVAALRAAGATARSKLGQLVILGRPDRVDLGRAPAWTPSRLAVTTLFMAALAYGIQATIDWTWFVPGPTVTALVAAGFVAGSGPARAASAEPEPRASLHPSAARVALAVLSLLAALAVSWSIWQPDRADRLADEAVALSGGGDYGSALAAAEDAQEIDPLAVKPLFAEAAVHQRAGRDDAALAVFERTVEKHPKDPQAWLRLADFQLYELDDPETALAALDEALYLDPMSEAIRDSFIEARTRLRARGLIPAEPAPVPAPSAPAPEAAP